MGAINGVLMGVYSVVSGELKSQRKNMHIHKSHVIIKYYKEKLLL